MPASPQPGNGVLAIGSVLLHNYGFAGAEFGLDCTGVFTLLSWRYWLLAGVLLVYLALRQQLLWPGSRAADSCDAEPSSRLSGLHRVK